MKLLIKSRKTLPETADLDRRRMLMRLGLAATAIYAAPIVAELSPARASSASGASGSGPSGSGRRSGSRRRSRSRCSASGGSCGPHGKRSRSIRGLFGSGPS
jgi:hypothetical protein